MTERLTIATRLAGNTTTSLLRRDGNACEIRERRRPQASLATSSPFSAGAALLLRQLNRQSGYFNASTIDCGGSRWRDSFQPSTTLALVTVSTGATTKAGAGLLRRP